MRAPVIVVGAKGFWSQRNVVCPLLPDGIEFLFDDQIRATDGVRDRVAALVVADQRVTGPLLDCFPNLQVIARTGTGYDNIDLAAARARKIIVTRVAKLNAEAVSEFALGLIFELVKNFTRLHESMMRGEWTRPNALRLSDLTVGIIGLGTIGRSVALKLHHLGARRILGWNRRPRPEIDQLAETSRLEPTDRDELLCHSDVVILTVALGPETARLIGERELALLKPTAFLINVCRGAVVDEEALARRVAEGAIGGVALDVFSVEPPGGAIHETAFMRSLQESARQGRRVLLSPHVAGLTDRSVERISQQVAHNIAGVLKGDLTDVELVQ